MTFTYETALLASQKVGWKLDDVLKADDSFDFGRPFLPESLARSSAFAFLSKSEALALNHIRAHTYLSIFGLVEEFILPFVIDHARPHLPEDDFQTRALLQFASEEAKHIQLFKRFREVFERQFGDRCEVIGPAATIAKAVLDHDTLGVALVILQIEWMSQRHFLESIEYDEAIDPRFKSLLRHHWMEEAQHARLDALMVEAIAEGRSLEERERAVEAYLAVGTLLDGGLVQQVELDLAALERRIRRQLSPSERATFREVQLAANRWTYLGSGMTHPKFLESLGRVLPSARLRVEQMAPEFSFPAPVHA
jgi:hypothetical protein